MRHDILFAAVLAGPIYQFGPCSLPKIDYDAHAEARSWFASCVNDAARIAKMDAPSMPSVAPLPIPPNGPQTDWAKGAMKGR